MWYVTLVRNGVHLSTQRFESWKAAMLYALSARKISTYAVEVWIGRDGEEAVKL